jgi:hypothetical protein
MKSPTRLNKNIAALAAQGGMAVALLFGNMNIAAAAWINGQAATFALGAANLNSGGGGTSASRFSSPSDVCADPATGKVFVIDLGNNRILRFSSAQGVTTDGTAEAVFGQPDFASGTANNGGISAGTLSAPWSCAVDAAGHLFVTDNDNHRVLRYDNAATKASSGAADGVLGQANFTSAASGTTSTNFGGGYLFVAIGQNGSLYVGDTSNKRVLRFDNAAGKANGAAADGVLGAPDFTTVGAGGYTASTFAFVQGVTVDTSGNLYVNDTYRILRFNNAASKANGAAADGVLGAPDFTTPASGPASQSNISYVRDIEALPDGALYTSDWNFSRILIFDNAAGKANGANADHVLGQPNFTTTGSGTTSTTFIAPLGIGGNLAQGYLMVADNHNNRVVGFYNADLLAAPSQPAAIPTLTGWGVISLAGLLGFVTFFTLRRGRQ